MGTNEFDAVAAATWGCPIGRTQQGRRCVAILVKRVLWAGELPLRSQHTGIEPVRNKMGLSSWSGYRGWRWPCAAWSVRALSQCPRSSRCCHPLQRSQCSYPSAAVSTAMYSCRRRRMMDSASSACRRCRISALELASEGWALVAAHGISSKMPGSRSGTVCSCGAPVWCACPVSTRCLGPGARAVSAVPGYRWRHRNWGRTRMDRHDRRACPVVSIALRSR